MSVQLYVHMFGLRRLCSQFFDLLVIFLHCAPKSMHYITQDHCQSDPVTFEIFVTIWSCSIGVTYNATQLTECSISLLYSFDMVICLHYAGIITPCIMQNIIERSYQITTTL